MLNLFEVQNIFSKWTKQYLRYFAKMLESFASNDLMYVECRLLRSSVRTALLLMRTLGEMKVESAAS